MSLIIGPWPLRPRRQWFAAADGTFYRNCPLIMDERKLAARWLRFRLAARLAAEWRVTFQKGITRKNQLDRSDVIAPGPALFRDAYPDEPGLRVLDGNTETGRRVIMSPVTLRWTTSASADDENHDQETSLDAIGSPGGAVWASVSPNSQPGYGPWVWVIYDRWLDVDYEPDPTLADGPAGSEEAAKAAVAEWVRAALAAAKGK